MASIYKIAKIEILIQNYKDRVKHLNEKHSKELGNGSRSLEAQTLEQVIEDLEAII